MKKIDKDQKNLVMALMSAFILTAIIVCGVAVLESVVWHSIASGHLVWSPL